MRLLLAVSEYHRGGGFPRHGADLASAFARRGHDVTVMTQRAELTPADAGIAIQIYRAPGPGTLGPMASEPYVLTRLLREQAGDYDAMFSIGIPVLAPVYLVGPGTHRGFVRQTVSLLPRGLRRTLEPMRPFHRVVLAWEKTMLAGEHPRGVIVAGERFRREYTDLYGVPADRVAVIPHGVDTTAFRPDAQARARLRATLGIAPDEKVLLNVAGRMRQKGLDVLVRALHRLPQDRPWRALFVGDGSTSRALVAQTAELRRAGRVQLLGRVDSVIDQYRAADVLVFPTRYDPWGMAVTEALAAGTPVVTTRHAGSAMAIVEGRNGAVVGDVEDDAEVAARTLDMMEGRFDPERVAGTVAHLTWDETAAATERLIEGRARTEERVRG